MAKEVRENLAQKRMKDILAVIIQK